VAPDWRGPSPWRRPPAAALGRGVGAHGTIRPFAQGRRHSFSLPPAPRHAHSKPPFHPPALTIFFNARSEAASKRHLSSQHPLIHPNAGPILLEDYHLVEKLANVSFV